MSIQGSFPLRLTGLIFLLSKGLSGVFSSTTVRRNQFFGVLLLYSPALPTLCDHWEEHSLDYMDLCRQSDVSAFQYTVQFCHSFPAKKQSSSDFTAAVTIHSDFRDQEEDTCHCFYLSPSICHEMMGQDAMILVFLMLSFKPAFSLSSFTLIKRYH